MNSTDTHIHLHIERLVLDGIDLPRHQRPALQAAIETELTRLITAAGLAAGWPTHGATPRLRAGRMQLDSASDPEQMGRQIAQAVYRGNDQ
jgi:2-hydroxychromene-2-carboxylate isomerase